MTQYGFTASGFRRVLNLPVVQRIIWKIISESGNKETANYESLELCNGAGVRINHVGM